MKLTSYEIDGLFGATKRVAASLHDDLNILTGRNGAGKTTILKLIWYIISGNILLALREIPFKRARIVTDLYDCTVLKISNATCKVDLVIDGKHHTFEDDVDDDVVFENAEDMANPLLIESGSSVFFPTFRRIEGGFTLSTPRATTSRAPRQRNEVEDALVTLARKLTNEPHTFVSAISTQDITAILLRKFADLSEESNALQQTASQEIIETIKAHKSDAAKAHKSDAPDMQRIDIANSVLDGIRSRIEKMERERELIMAPIAAVQEVVTGLFKHSGISIGPRLSFGDAAGAINSNLLSAGEKQMLSFICYNAFYTNSVVFIDEPELSLHADWQRLLFSILRDQRTGNQFIIATHSPFIYAKYPDKEVIIDSDRGDTADQG